MEEQATSNRPDEELYRRFCRETRHRYFPGMSSRLAAFASWKEAAALEQTQTRPRYKNGQEKMEGYL